MNADCLVRKMMVRLRSNADYEREQAGICLVRKMMVRLRSNADYERGQAGICLVRKMMVRLRSNADYERERAGICLVHKMMVRFRLNAAYEREQAGICLVCKIIVRFFFGRTLIQAKKKKKSRKCALFSKLVDANTKISKNRRINVFYANVVYKRNESTKRVEQKEDYKPLFCFSYFLLKRKRSQQKDAQKKDFTFVIKFYRPSLLA